MRFKALRHQPSDAARKSGYDNEGQLPDTLPDSRSRPEAVRDERLLRRGSIAIDTRAAKAAWIMLQWTLHRFAGWT